MVTEKIPIVFYGHVLCSAAPQLPRFFRKLLEDLAHVRVLASWHEMIGGDELKRWVSPESTLNMRLFWILRFLEFVWSINLSSVSDKCEMI